jgi:hypothetical protein
VSCGKRERGCSSGSTGEKHAKYFSYREARGRIRRAKGQGYHSEAVTLEKSIRADRLF